MSDDDELPPTWIKPDHLPNSYQYRNPFTGDVNDIGSPPPPHMPSTQRRAAQRITRTQWIAIPATAILTALLVLLLWSCATSPAHIAMTTATTFPSPSATATDSGVSITIGYVTNTPDPNQAAATAVIDATMTAVASATIAAGGIPPTAPATPTAIIPTTRPGQPTYTPRPAPTATPRPAPTATNTPAGAVEVTIAPLNIKVICLGGTNVQVTLTNPSTTQVANWSATSTISATTPTSGSIAPGGSQIMTIHNIIGAGVVLVTSGGKTQAITITC